MSSHAHLPLPQNLDVQYTIGLATGVPVDFISVGIYSYDGVGGFLDTANYVLSEDSSAYVMTTSYNADEENISADVYRWVCLVSPSPSFDRCIDETHVSP